jgi:hypothetical protein
MNLSSGQGGRYTKRLDRWTHVKICVCGFATSVATEPIAAFAIARHICPELRTPATTSRPRVFVDLVAVERTCAGDRPPLNRAERREVVRRLTDAGESSRQIGERLGVTARSVERLRRRIRERSAATATHN